MKMCNRCGKEIKGKVWKFEEFEMCENCYWRARYELGYDKEMVL